VVDFFVWRLSRRSRFGGLAAGLNGDGVSGPVGGRTVVGAYPPGQDWDLRRGDPAEHDECVANIARVPEPDADPVGGSLTELWT
jgi:hypothetical protein